MVTVDDPDDIEVSSDSESSELWLAEKDFKPSSEDEFQNVKAMNVGVPECEGLPCRDCQLWIIWVVTLYNEAGTLVDEGVCHSVNLDLVLGANGKLDDTHVAIHISKTHSEEDLPEEQVCSLLAWPIHLVHCHGASLKDHEARDNFNKLQQALLNPPLRPYTSVIRNAPRQASSKLEELLIQESILVVSTKLYCSQNCVQPFPRDKIRAFRERMYCNLSFKHRAYIKMDVHRQVHVDERGRRMVSIDNIPVCMRAWMHIAGVYEAIFYCYQSSMRRGQETKDHGNKGMVKPKKHTQLATATLKCILEKEADHMSHRTKTLKSGEKVMAKILPSTFQWKGKMKEFNDVNVAFRLNEVSTLNLNKIRCSKFPKYEVKKPGDNFARRGTYDKLNDLKKGAISGSHNELKFSQKLDRHNAITQAHRELYYANRHGSVAFPHECLTVMYDKMDHAKTASPVFFHRIKELDGLVRLPVSISGMIAHGHGDVRYAHYGLDLFKHDLNYTIRSMAKLLQDLEFPPKSSPRQLFSGSGSSNLFKAVLQGREMCDVSLPPPSVTAVPATPLPPILNVQMDNATGNNKNIYVFCFWSLLVAKKIFQEVYVNFMIVGHTHDNFDALFGRWSMQLKKENFPTIPALMKLLMDVESIPTIPHLIEEVPDFKRFIAGKWMDGNEILFGHTRPQQVKFYLDAGGCPVMKYKLKYTDANWLGKHGQAIKFWKEDKEGRSLWPCGVSKLVSLNPMKGVNDIVKGLSGFINYWDDLCRADMSGEYWRRYENVVRYWRGIKVALQEPLPISSVLKDGFWPTTRVEATEADYFDEDGKDLEEYGEDELYIGPLRDRPQPSFRVVQDLYEGYFVAVRPADGDSRPIWIARALSDPNSNPEQPNCVLIQYFRPTSHNQEVQDFYAGWDSERGLLWKVDETEEPVWETTNALITAWKSQNRRGTCQCRIKIPTVQIEIINQSLASYT